MAGDFVGFPAFLNKISIDILPDIVYTVNENDYQIQPGLKTYGTRQILSRKDRKMADIIIIAVLAVIVFFIVRSQFRKVRRGQCVSGCSNCAGCAHCAAGCSSEKLKEKA